MQPDQDWVIVETPSVTEDEAVTRAVAVQQAAINSVSSESEQTSAVVVMATADVQSELTSPDVAMVDETEVKSEQTNGVKADGSELATPTPAVTETVSDVPMEQTSEDAKTDKEIVDAAGVKTKEETKEPKIL